MNLFKNESLLSECIDTNAEITLTDFKYFTSNFKDVFIRIMITFIIIRSLDVQKHIINKYVIASIYFSNTNDKDRAVKTLIIKKIHLVNNFKANILIENDILNSKFIDVLTFKSSTYIKNCDVIISIRMQIRTSRMQSIHITKTIVMSSQIEFAVSIHNIVIFNYDYIFESDEINFSIYVYVVNANIKIILIKNDISVVLTISRNFRLEKLIEMNYSNVCLMNVNVVELTLRRFKSEHKKAWFNKILQTYIVVKNLFSSTNTTLFNNVTIHNFFDNAVKVFIKFVHEFFSLWINQEFVNLFEQNWMKISLKANWKFKIKNKVKMYFVEIKNRIVINETFNKLHKKNKLSWINEFTLFNFSCFVIWQDSTENKKKQNCDRHTQSEHNDIIERLFHFIANWHNSNC